MWCISHFRDAPYLFFLPPLLTHKIPVSAAKSII